MMKKFNAQRRQLAACQLAAAANDRGCPEFDLMSIRMARDADIFENDRQLVGLDTSSATPSLAIVL